MNIYLIDYENTNGHGLYGLEKLGMFDKVFIFYTKNANSLHFEHMEAINKAKANVKLMLVEAGRENSLDFQLSSFLGFQISKHPFADFFVVTRDKGYTCLEGFWKENNRNVKILPNIAGEDIPVQPKTATQKKQLKASKDKNKFTAQKPKTKQTKTTQEPKKQPPKQVTKPVANQAPKPLETSNAQQPVKQVEPAKNTEELYKMVFDVIGNKKDSEIITNILIRSKSKIEIHTSLQQKFNSSGSNRATKIYRKILPLIPENLTSYNSFIPFSNAEPNPELVNEIKKYVKKQRNADIIADILSSSKTNKEVHSKLQLAFNAESPTKAGNIYKAIRPLLPEQSQPKKQKFESNVVKPSYDKELFDKVLALIENESDAKIVAEILATTETKQEIHEKLQKTFNSSSNTESGVIYKKIKPLLPKTPSKPDEPAVSSNTDTAVNTDNFNDNTKDVTEKIISDNALNISNTLIVDDSL